MANPDHKTSPDPWWNLITIQPEATPDTRRPYPFHINPEGDCTKGAGTHDTDPTIPPDAPWRLFGFAREDNFWILDLENFGPNPHKALNLYPIFTDHEDEDFILNTPITAITTTNTTHHQATP